jgi:hypothetical protein
MLTGADRAPPVFTGQGRHFRGCDTMKTSRNRFGLLAASAASVLLLGVGPGWAQTSVPCSAFARSGNGAWRVLDPVMLDLNGRLYSPTVGTVFPAGATQHGIEMSDMLDQQCGNR